MIIGILSDTHDRHDMAKAAVEILRQRGAEVILHCGDVGGKLVIDQLAGAAPTVGFVWGNNDFDQVKLAKYAQDLNVKCYGSFGDLTIGGKRFALMHGDDFRLKQKILSQQEFDYLLLGHTHVPEDKAVQRTRVINPGALYRASSKTVATLDLQKDQLEFVTVISGQNPD